MSLKAKRAAHAAYVRQWEKRNRARLRTQRQKKIAALLLAGVTGTRPCSGCGKPIAVTAHRIASRFWRCYRCAQAGKRKQGRQQKYQAKHPLKLIAHRLTNRAVTQGTLVRLPCESCGAAKVEAHHDDYSKPLQVRWLCRPCHLAEHHPHRKTEERR